MLPRREVPDDRILAERLKQIFGDDESLVIATEEHESTMHWYSIVPRLNGEVRMGDLLKISGEKFTLFYAKSGGIEAFIYTSASNQSLRRFFDVSKAAPKPFNFAAIAGARKFRSDKYYLDLYIPDLPGCASKLPNGCAVS